MFGQAMLPQIGGVDQSGQMPGQSGAPQRMQNPSPNPFAVMLPTAQAPQEAQQMPGVPPQLVNYIRNIRMLQQGGEGAQQVIQKKISEGQPPPDVSGLMKMLDVMLQAQEEGKDIESLLSDPELMKGVMG